MGLALSTLIILCTLSGNGHAQELSKRMEGSGGAGEPARGLAVAEVYQIVTRPAPAPTPVYPPMSSYPPMMALYVQMSQPRVYHLALLRGGAGGRGGGRNRLLPSTDIPTVIRVDTGPRVLRSDAGVLRYVGRFSNEVAFVRFMTHLHVLGPRPFRPGGWRGLGRGLGAQDMASFAQRNDEWIRATTELMTLLRADIFTHPTIEVRRSMERLLRERLTMPN